MRGSRPLIADWAGTVVFVATAVAAAVWPAGRPVAVAVALVLFAVGIVAFLTAYGIAVARSRNDAIGIGGLYFLAGDVAPAGVRRAFMAALAVQIVVALATAAVRPFTTLAFGILVPMFGLGLSGVWGARHGFFERRFDDA